ncbi:DUF4956 domain-containing protein [Prolixibacteraceae bacterium Z1-6]|uniref:DUF4956 domain-containing protein n=1 Tax=Draconibacterium aestuarii TaxID=2998507 RepID=A0A9X3F8F9_9BACT|nr:DUF4956 domain-containing protein [Prolixibacteraceae bacterium Z1-6]
MTAFILLQIINEIKINGINLINIQEFLQLLIRFVFNLVVIIIVIRGIYYRKRRKKDFLFSFFAVSTVVFFLCFLLESVKLELGFALGLFAIFGIIRYRTKVIPIREMTYLFVVIGISVINALASKEISYAELLFTNIALVVLLYTLERLNYRLDDGTIKKMTLHEKIDTIDLSNEEELKVYLSDKTRLNIIRYTLGKIDYNAQTVEIVVFYQSE